ncbi:hypothetical protein CJ195_03800 [Bacillus sp. UMB0899]|uniref:spore germination protein n=1 Tax=Metabacillus schmidteae TaxID=2730405 RepID=UPI000C80B86E|nr:spore germination protein [Metabacillus schmidteae]PMC39074.1 hypothetical protein CJ195_03800 [Bacillus sp. UMB0899]
MPCFIKKVTIESVNGGVVNFGDSQYISPKTVESTTSGSGGGGTGDFQLVIHGQSVTNSSETDS